MHDYTHQVIIFINKTSKSWFLKMFHNNHYKFKFKNKINSFGFSYERILEIIIILIWTHN